MLDLFKAKRAPSCCTSLGPIYDQFNPCNDNLYAHPKLTSHPKCYELLDWIKKICISSKYQKVKNSQILSSQILRPLKSRVTKRAIFYPTLSEGSHWVLEGGPKIVSTKSLYLWARKFKRMFVHNWNYTLFFTCDFQIWEYRKDKSFFFASVWIFYAWSGSFFFIFIFLLRGSNFYY